MGVPNKGIPTSCQASNLYRDKEEAIFIDEPLGITLTDIKFEVEIHNVFVNGTAMELYFNSTEDLQPGRKYFWKLPVQFLGNKLTSYGGYLSFTLINDRKSQSDFSTHQILLSGNGIQMEHLANSSQSNEEQNFRIFLHESM
jgi:Laminin B (Domain IV)